MSGTLLSTSTRHPYPLPDRERWRSRITRNGTVGAVEVPGPFGPAYLTPRQHMLMIWIGRGRRITLREVPISIYPSLSGLHRALTQLQRLGLVGHVSRRGRYGFTRLWRNVRTMSSRGATVSHTYRLLLPVGRGANIHPASAGDDGASAPPRPRLGRLECRDGLWIAV